jgi:Sel1 repeat
MTKLKRSILILLSIFIFSIFLGYAHAIDFEENKKIADQGYAYAQSNMGLFYYHGVDVRQDYAEAARWFHKAAEQGHVQAQYYLGLLYFNGDGVRQNRSKAEKWYRKAAEQGHADAQNDLGGMYEHNQGIRQNYSEAEKWYRKAAEQGHADAQNNLGTFYGGGKGLTENHTEAARWFHKAAEQGHEMAKSNLRISERESTYQNNSTKEEIDYRAVGELIGGILKYGMSVSENNLSGSNTGSQVSQEDNSEYEACWSRVYKDKIATCRASFVSLACDHSGCVRKFDCDKRGFSGCNRVLGRYENWDKYYCNTDNRDYSHDLDTVINNICLK